VTRTEDVARRVRAAAPAVAVLAVAAALLLATGTPELPLLRYAAYLVWGVLLPGTLVHRALRRRTVRLSEDLAAGVVVGLGLELGVSVVLVRLGAQHLLPWWPLAVVVPMLAVRPLRRCWRWGGAPGWTPGQAWALAAVTGAVLLWVAQAQWLQNPINPALAWQALPDLPFHAAVAAETRNHVPPTAPWVLGQPLDYHWFVHVHLATAGAVAHVDLWLLLVRLYLLPLLGAGILLTAVAAARLSGSGWAGPTAAGLAYAVGDLSPYVLPRAVFGEGGPLGITLWYSPTQAYATPVLALVLVLLTDLLRGHARRAGTWTLLVLAVGVLAGAKATFLPVLGAGLGVAFAVQLLRGRVDRVLLAAALLVGATGLAAMLVLFGGARQGLRVDPLGSLQQAGGGRVLLAGDPPAALVVAVAVFAAASWCVRLAGAAIVIRRRWDDPAVGLLAGAVAAGLAGTLLTAQYGGSHFYFLRAAMPLGAVLAAWGLAVAFAEVAAPRRALRLVFAAAATGAAAATAVALLVPNGLRSGPTPWPEHVDPWPLLGHLAVPPLVLLAACVLAGILFARAPGVASRRRAALALTLVAVSATGLLRLGLDTADGARWAFTRGPVAQPRDGGEALGVSPSTVAAARWLRAHSGARDVVATNLHCRVERYGACDNRRFWISAFAERRVLVEGWGFTSRSNADFLAHPEYGGPHGTPFWEPARLRAGNAAISSPTPARLAHLRDHYGVRWLFVYRHEGTRPAPDLGQVATLRWRGADADVYELTS
jgi:hypothetical protein